MADILNTSLTSCRHLYSSIVVCCRRYKRLTICRSATYDFFQVVCMWQSCWSYVAPSSVLSVYYDKICIKFASHLLLLYVVYMCQKSLNFTYDFKCYQQKYKNIKYTLAGPPCIYWVGANCQVGLYRVTRVTRVLDSKLESVESSNFCLPEYSEVKK